MKPRCWSIAPLLTVLCAAQSFAGSPKQAVDQWTWASDARQATADGDHQRAAELYERLVEAAPGNGEYWLRLGDECLQIDAADRAAQALEHALELGHGEAEWLAYTIARIHAYVENDEQALDWLARSIELGFVNRGRFARDELFERLRDEPRFKTLLGPEVSEDVSREEGWRIDLEFLASEAARLHAGLEGQARSDTFQGALRDLASGVSALDDHQVLWEIRRLIASLGDGHTSAYVPRAEIVEMVELPVVLYLFEDGLFIIDAEDESLVGSEVVAFGDLKASEALGAIAPYISRDNEHGIAWFGPYYLTFPSLLREIGGASHVDRATLALCDAEGNTSVQEVVGAEARRWRKLEHPAIDDAPPAPLYLSRPASENFWLEALPDLGAMYVHFSRLRDKDDESLEQFSARMLDAARSSGATRLILDVRRDNGGNGRLITPLVRALVAFEMASPDHRIFVLTGRGTFSACQIFITQIEQLTNAIFVGEPSSSSPNFVGEESEIRLPYSGVDVSISTLYWQGSSANDDRRWIDVDIPVTLSSEDYFAGHDSVMEAIKSVVSGEER